MFYVLSGTLKSWGGLVLPGVEAPGIGWPGTAWGGLGRPPGGCGVSGCRTKLWRPVAACGSLGRLESCSMLLLASHTLELQGARRISTLGGASAGNVM